MSITGHSRSVTLRSGGVIFIGMTGVTIGDFGDAERELFDRLIDAIEEYEAFTQRAESSRMADAVDPVGGRVTD